MLSLLLFFHIHQGYIQRKHRSKAACKQQSVRTCRTAQPKTPESKPRTCRNAATMDRPVITRYVFDIISAGPVSGV